MSPVGAVEAVLLGVGTLGLGYTVLLGLVAAGRRSGRGPSGGRPAAVLIPAHDEERWLGRLLEDLRSPIPAVTLVVADRCTDDTAGVAERGGAEVLELSGGEGGKGRALAAGLDHLQRHEWDCAVVVDADCRLPAGFLDGIDVPRDEAAQSACELRAGQEGRGLLYDFLSRLENDVLHAGRARLGLPAFLRGTGMILGRDALARCPWQGEGLAEDRAQGLAMLRAGVPVRYAETSAVRTEPPRGGREAWTQRRRWSSTSLIAGVLAAAGAVPGAWRAFGPRAAELPLAALADARSQWGALLVAAVLMDAVLGGPFRAWAWGASAVAGLGAGGLAVRWYGVRSLRVLMEAPVALAVAIGAGLLGLLGWKPGRWSRGRRG